MQVGDIVRVNDKTDWQGLYGIIDRIHEDLAFVFCVNRPGHLHPVSLKDLISEEIKTKNQQYLP